MKISLLKRISSFVVACFIVMSASSCNEKIRETDTDQLALPKVGEEIAVMHTSAGDIYFRLFPEDAPKAVENFIYHAQKDNYNGVKVFRSEPNYLIQTGDYENNDGTGGKSKWGNGFRVELSSSLHHIRGALGMARGENRNSQGSQFYVITRAYVSVAYSEELKETNPELAKKYEENGGIPELDGDYTVFGQAFAGFAALDELNKGNTSDESDDTEDVYILGVEIVKYAEGLIPDSAFSNK